MKTQFNKQSSRRTKWKCWQWTINSSSKKNTVESINSKLNWGEESTYEYEDRSFESKVDKWIK